MTHQTVSLGKYWKLFPTTLRRLERVFCSCSVYETIEDYKERYLMVWTNYISPCSLCISQIEASTSPPRAYPGHLTSFPAREEGIWLTKSSRGRAFDHYSLGVGNLIASLDFMLRVALIPRGVINHDEDKPPCIQSERYPIRGGLAEKQRLAQALLCTWRYSRTIYIIFGM